MTLLEAAAGPSSSWLLANAMHLGTVEERQRIGRLETVCGERERERERGNVIRSEGASSIIREGRVRQQRPKRERERDRRTDGQTEGGERGKWKIGRFPLLDGAGGGAKTACQPVVVVD